jgi:hypothetical protein
MEWTYTIVKPITINVRSIYDVYQHLAPDLAYIGKLEFNHGEIDKSLYDSLVKGYPDHVTRTPKNELVAAVYAARGIRG